MSEAYRHHILLIDQTAAREAPVADLDAEARRRNRWPRLWTALALAGILLLAASLRIRGLGEQSFWFDECCTVLAATGHRDAYRELSHAGGILDASTFLSLEDAAPWWSPWTTIRHNVHPPLHPILYRLWIELFGNTDAAGRSLSVVASLIAILLLFDLGRQLYGPGPALWACAIMAVAMPQIQYAQEARAYAPILALCLGAAVALVRIEKLGVSAGRILALVLCTLAALLFNYSVVGALLALLIYALIRLRGPRRWTVLLSLASAVLLFLILWGPALLTQANSLSIVSWQIEAPEGHLLRSLYRLACLPAMHLVSVPERFLPIAACGIAAALLPLLALRRRPQLLLPCLWCSSVILLILVLDLRRNASQLAYIRYTFIAAPAMYLLACATLWRNDGAIRHLAPALAFLLACAGLLLIHPPQKPDWRGLAAEINRHVRAGDLVVYDGNDSDHALFRHLGTLRYLPPPATRLMLLAPRNDPRVICNLAASHRTWIVANPEFAQTQTILPGFTVRPVSQTLTGALFRALPPSARAATPATRPAAGLSP